MLSALLFYFDSLCIVFVKFSFTSCASSVRFSSAVFHLLMTLCVFPSPLFFIIVAFISDVSVSVSVVFLIKVRLDFLSAATQDVITLKDLHRL